MFHVKQSKSLKHICYKPSQHSCSETRLKCSTGAFYRLSAVAPYVSRETLTLQNQNLLPRYSGRTINSNLYFRFDNQISTLPTDLYTVLLKNVDNLLIMWITYLCMFHVEQMQLDTKKGRPIYSVSPSAWCIYIITLELNTLINSSYPCFYY